MINEPVDLRPFRPISALCEKNNPPVSEERDSEISNICLRLFFSHALISNENAHKSTDSFITKENLSGKIYQ